MVYLHLTLTNFKGQCPGHEHLYCEYLENSGDWYDKYFCSQCIWNCLLAFDCCIYIWPWPILKTKVKVKFWYWIFHKRWQTEQILLLPTHIKSLIGFYVVRLYLYLTLTYSEWQGQGHSQFDYEIFDKTEPCCIRRISASTLLFIVWNDYGTARQFQFLYQLVAPGYRLGFSHFIGWSNYFQFET